MVESAAHGLHGGRNIRRRQEPAVLLPWLLPSFEGCPAAAHRPPTAADTGEKGGGATGNFARVCQTSHF